MKKIEIDNVLGGHNSDDKLSYIYQDLRKEVLVEEPVWSSPQGLIIIDNSFRKGDYHAELFRTSDYEIMLEGFGRWEGYANQREFPKLGDRYFWGLTLTIFNGGIEIKKSIENIISRYPRKKKEATNISSQ